MDCDPPASLILQGAQTSQQLPATSTNAQQQQRYVPHPHLHRNRYVAATAVIGPNPMGQVIGGSGGGGGGVVTNHKSNSSSNSGQLLNNFAPSSLPIDLGQINSGGGGGAGGGSSNNVNLLMADHAIISSAANNYLLYTPFSDAAALQLGQKVNLVGGNSSGSVSGNGNSGVGGSSGNNSGLGSLGGSGGNLATSQQRSSGSNDRDESPMVGVCVQQSPQVVIH
jgi:hypothetical protein